MKSTLKTALVLLFVYFLAACGGGGSSDGGGSDPTDAGKYAGTYSGCNNDNVLHRLTLSGTGNGNYTVTDTEIYYQNSNCTGEVLATYSTPLPSTLSFVETAIAIVSAPGLASSLSLDKYKLSIPSTTASLTGPGVAGNCVNFPGGGSSCYSTLNEDAEQLDIGFYKTSAGFYSLTLENGVYVNEDPVLYVKE